MNTKDFPPITDELLTALGRLVPDRVPRKELSPFQQGVLVGGLEVVDTLRKVHENQTRKAMK